MTLAPPDPRHTLRARGSVLALLASAGLTLAACGPGVATPVPEPPTLQLEKIGPDSANIMVASNGGRHVVGAKGAAPAGVLVRVVNLDRKDPTSVSNVQADGSFDLRVAVQDGEELRFDWLSGSTRGEPLDARFVDDARSVFHLEASPRLECLELTPGFAVGFAGSNVQPLLVRNGCTADVVLSVPRARLALSDFALQTALPLTVSAGQSATLDLTFTASVPGAREDTLFIDVTAQATTLRYPITLFAP